MRITTVGGQVVRYTVQYETTIDGERVPVVRFDNAHGFPHRDLLNRHGEIKRKDPLPGQPGPGAALTAGKQDIQDNWQRYRQAFLEDEP